MSRTLRVIAYQQFLEKLFARPQSGIYNLNVAVRRIRSFLLKPHQVDHLTGKVGYSYWFAYDQHVNLTPLTHAGSLKHQLAGFRNGLEVTDDIRMRNRYRHTITNLVSKKRHHRSRR